MTTRVIRQKLHNYLEVADDKMVKAMYALMEGEIEEMNVSWSPEYKNELDARYAAYKKGTVKTVSPEESKRRVEKILKNVKRK